jgi:hypothetical protein
MVELRTPRVDALGITGGCTHIGDPPDAVIPSDRSQRGNGATADWPEEAEAEHVAAVQPHREPVTAHPTPAIGYRQTIGSANTAPKVLDTQLMDQSRIAASQRLHLLGLRQLLSIQHLTQRRAGWHNNQLMPYNLSAIFAAAAFKRSMIVAVSTSAPASHNTAMAA